MFLSKTKYKVVPVTKQKHDPLFMQWEVYGIKKRIVPFWWRFLTHNKVVTFPNGRTNTSIELLLFNSKKEANEEMFNLDVTGKEIHTTVWADKKRTNVCRKKS